MRCEDVLGAVAAGEALSEAQAAHRAGCARCRAAEALTGARVRVVGVAPAVPDRAALVGRERRRVAAWTGGVGLAAALGLVVLAGGAGESISRPPVDAGAGLMEAASTSPEDPPDGPRLAALLADDPLATPLLSRPLAPEPLADLEDPTDLFDAAPAGGRSP